LAAEAGTEAALKKIFRAKGREEGKPSFCWWPIIVGSKDSSRGFLLWQSA